MTRLKDAMTAGVDRSQIIVIVGDKGGQGKSLTALAIADHATLHEAPLAVAQIDTQQRLAQALGRNVLTIPSDPKAIRRDPSAEARAFTPLYTMLEKAAARSAHVLIDSGANQALRLVHWGSLVDLAEDLEAWGFDVSIFAVYVAEAEGMRKAAEAAHAALELLPEARLVMVENERDGRTADLHPSSEAAEIYTTQILPLQRRATVLHMPAVAAGAWRPFEAARARLIGAVQMPIDRVMKLSGLPRPEAKIIRGDVAAFAAEFFAELDRVLPWGRTGGNHA